MSCHVATFAKDLGEVMSCHVATFAKKMTTYDIDICLNPDDIYAHPKWDPVDNSITKLGRVRPHPDPRRAVPDISPHGRRGWYKIDFGFSFSARPNGQISFRQWVGKC